MTVTSEPVFRHHNSCTSAGQPLRWVATAASVLALRLSSVTISTTKRTHGTIHASAHDDEPDRGMQHRVADELLDHDEDGPPAAASATTMPGPGTEELLLAMASPYAADG